MKLVWIGSFFLLTACSSHFSEQQCASSNWYSVGVSDAWAGKDISQLQSYQEQCADYGLTPNQSEWKKGYLSALHKQCSADKALALVANQQSYTGPCLADPEFNKALHSNVEAVQRSLQMKKIETRLTEIQREKLIKNGKKNEDLGWEEYQLQQELLDLKGTVQIADPEPVNKF